LKDKYLELLIEDEIPHFLKKYLMIPALIRLKNVGYFCGMDYASKDIYDFGEYISRFDHSLNVALWVWRFTKDKTQTLAGLFHDIATPCFSHVIDYMNKDYKTQESTEEFTEKILKSDEMLKTYLNQDGVDIDELVNFKNYSIVDIDRPSLCADRLDGVILPGLFWTKSLNIEQVKYIVENTVVLHNEGGVDEIGFKNKRIAELVVKTSKKIDEFCHSNEDNYMMELLANITKFAIDNDYIKYEELYVLTEKELFEKFDMIKNSEFRNNLNKFKNIKKSNIDIISLPNVKARNLNPLVNGLRFIDIE